MQFTTVRPYPNEVCRILAGTGLIPLDDKICTFFSTEADAKTILGLAHDAAVNLQAQSPNTLGIAQPAPTLGMFSGEVGNSLMDTFEGETSAQVIYAQRGCPRLYYVAGNVTILDKEFPNDESRKVVLTIDDYCGALIAAYKPGQTKLVLRAAQGGSGVGELYWA